MFLNSTDPKLNVFGESVLSLEKSSDGEVVIVLTLRLWRPPQSRNTSYRDQEKLRPQVGEAN